MNADKLTPEELDEMLRLARASSGAGTEPPIWNKIGDYFTTGGTTAVVEPRPLRDDK
jgi:hypothetical protein